MEKEKFIDRKDAIVTVFSVSYNGTPYVGEKYFNETTCDCATEKEAVALWAEGRLSLIRRNDENRYGRLLTNDELNDPCLSKYKIYREAKYIYVGRFLVDFGRFSFLSEKFARNFLSDNRELLKKYFML